MEKCELCNAFNGEHGYIKDEIGNTSICPNMSQEQIKKQLILYFKVFQDFSKREAENRGKCNLSIYKSRQEMLFWKGRFYEVKHENNQLRKQIEKWKLKKN
jgi:hypothetical protein